MQGAPGHLRISQLFASVYQGLFLEGFSPEILG